MEKLEINTTMQLPVTGEMKHFKVYSKEDVLSLTKIRRFETKVGERLEVLKDVTDIAVSIKSSTAKYVLFGVPEDLGVKGNLGIGGADTLWIPFLQSFLNVQSNDFFDGNQILLAGHFDFGDIQYLIDTTAKSEEEKIEAFRHAVIAVDENANNPLSKEITMNIPLREINIILRLSIFNSGSIEYKNFVMESSGINVWIDIVNNPFIDCITYEDIFVHEKRTFMQAVSHATGFTEDTLTGIDLDLDSIQNTLSSAMTPVGISSTLARQYVSFAAADSKPAYFHICEGATRLSDGRTDATSGKLISYLVSDFIKGNSI